MKSFWKERKLSVVFEEEKKEINNVNAEISRRPFSLSTLYFLFNANLLKICRELKKTRFHKICKRRKCVDIQYKYERKLQNIKKITRKFYNVTSISWNHIFIHKIWIDLFQKKNLINFNEKIVINLKEIRLIFDTNIRILEL